METAIMGYIGFIGYMGGCQNYGRFWIPIIIRHLISRVPKKGTIILTITHIEEELWCPTCSTVHLLRVRLQPEAFFQLD